MIVYPLLRSLGNLPKGALFLEAMVERLRKPETIGQIPPVVLRCLDFRTDEPTKSWLTDQGLDIGTYYLYASAGASGNPEGFLQTVNLAHHSAFRIINHRDCAYYKATCGDSEKNHQDHLARFGRTLHMQNPQVDYKSHIVRLDDPRHSCTATAIILGEPEIVKAAEEEIARLGLTDDHDKIARPYRLSVDDRTIFTDLEISISRHHPSRILIFDNEKERALDLVQAVKRVAQPIPIETVTFENAS